MRRVCGLSTRSIAYAATIPCEVITNGTHVVIMLVLVVWLAIASAKSWSCLNPMHPHPPHRNFEPHGQAELRSKQLELLPRRPRMLNVFQA